MARMVKSQIKANPSLRQLAESVVAANMESKQVGGLLRTMREKVDVSLLPYQRQVPELGAVPMAYTLGVSYNTLKRIEKTGEFTSFMVAKTIKKALQDALQDAIE